MAGFTARMSTLVIEVEEELVVRENERFVVEFRGRGGRLVAESVSPLGTESGALESPAMSGGIVDAAALNAMSEADADAAIDAIADQMVQQMGFGPREGTEPAEDRQRAAEDWLRESTGILSGMTDAEADEARYEYLAARHLK